MNPTAATPCPRRTDAGSAAISIAIVFPAIAMLFLALAQAVMVAAAREVALSSAEEGLRVARAHDGTPAQGQNAAIRFARREPVLGSPAITVSGTTTITVQVRGRAPSILPGVHLDVSESARGARERFTTPQQP
ncbi:hypothetical protein [Actinomadura sp. SCN-SB]|uniref:hypothetical protein n=1 Tax=Actinomadura sp. SCN-SB TaxID=3373092 RepID=UPI003750615C